MRTLTVRGYVAVAILGLFIALGVMVAGSARAHEAIVHHATGTLDVPVTLFNP